ncbi:hypothetical protein [Pontiella sp.]|uniref:hypothetical protein n=1 Tax=Pontiella sp. TaxID=2837462 RepID=UPI0035653BEC
MNQTNYLLDQQIQALEEQFVTDGGSSEKPAAERRKERKKQKTDDPVPDFPTCGKAMVLQTAKTGKNAGYPFRGCSAYPDGRGVVEV